MNCPNLSGDGCSVVKELSGYQWFPDSSVCNKCQKHSQPMQVNVFTIGQAIASRSMHGKPFADLKVKTSENLEQFERERLEICLVCEHSVKGTWCNLLRIKTGKAGALLHPRGIRRKESKCPAGKWNECDK